jgi:chitinase
VVEVCVDGTSCVTGGSWEDFFRDVEGNPTRTVDSILFRTGGVPVGSDPCTPFPTCAANAGDGFFIDDLDVDSYTHSNPDTGVGARLSVSGPTNITEGNAGSTNATYTATLNEPLPFTVTVDYSTQNGSATAPSDYTTTSGTFTYLPGETTKSVAVPVNGDTSDEPHENFSFALSNEQAVGRGPGASSGDFVNRHNATKTTNIRDEDSVVSVGDATVAEGNAGQTPMPFAVTLANASSVTVTVKFSTANGSAVAPGDYAAITNQTVTFAPGETSKTVNVQANGDVTLEGDESFTAVLSSPTNATIGDAFGLGVILNDD